MADLQLAEAVLKSIKRHFQSWQLLCSRAIIPPPTSMNETMLHRGHRLGVHHYVSSMQINPRGDITTQT
eukprot:m.506166 g.506166  ORF g.506166 m.506166 type:complete len:69 (-) comp57371_c0_seq8:838-1044(-)